MWLYRKDGPAGNLNPVGHVARIMAYLDAVSVAAKRKSKRESFPRLVPSCSCLQVVAGEDDLIGDLVEKVKVQVGAGGKPMIFPPELDYVPLALIHGHFDNFFNGTTKFQKMIAIGIQVGPKPCAVGIVTCRTDPKDIVLHGPVHRVQGTKARRGSAIAGTVKNIAH